MHPEEHGHTPHHPYLQHHFDSMPQQAEASTLGMWVFLVTEIMFFGGLVMAYLVYRHQSPQGFQEASHHLNVYWGAANTAILIISSLTMAFAVRAAQTSQPRKTQVMWLGFTMLLGGAFLGIKAIEYWDKFIDHIVPGPYSMKGCIRSPPSSSLALLCDDWIARAAHGHRIGIMSDPIMARRKRFDELHAGRSAGLYWHFVTSCGFSCSRCCI
jgi:cytochrome c oxidase subunit 3